MIYGNDAIISIHIVLINWLRRGSRLTCDTDTWHMNYTNITIYMYPFDNWLHDAHTWHGFLYNLFVSFIYLFIRMRTQNYDLAMDLRHMCTLSSLVIW